MEFIDLGRGGEKLPVIGMGTWKIGENRSEAIESLRTGIGLGSRFIDTAEMYGTESLVGEAIRGEKEIFIATKVSPHHLRYDDVIKACERSLKALGIKRIDLYQIHWPNPSIPIEETMRAMERLVDEGKIRHIGVSNFSLRELKEAQAAMKKHEIVSNQVEYSVVSRQPEKELSGYCRSEKVTIIAYSPLGQGALYTPKYKALLSELEKIGSRYGKTGSQVALNWLVSKGNVSAIPKAGRKEHMEENLGSIGWRMERGDAERIDAFFKGHGQSLAHGISGYLLRRSSGFWAKQMTKRWGGGEN